MRSKDKLRLLENIIAKVGLDGPVMEEYTKSLSILNGMESMSAMQPPPPPIAPPEPLQAPMSQNQGELPPLGAGGLETPQMA